MGPVHLDRLVAGPPGQPLSPEEFAKRFGLDATGLSKVATWLESEGCRITYIARSRSYLTCQGSGDLTPAGEIQSSILFIQRASLLSAALYALDNNRAFDKQFALGISKMLIF